MTGYFTAALALVAGAVVFYRAQAEADDRSSRAHLALHPTQAAPAAHVDLPQGASLVPLRRTGSQVT
jgi:hypothetical protein